MDSYICWMDILDADTNNEYGLDIPNFNDPEMKSLFYSPPRYMENFDTLEEFFCRKLHQRELNYEQADLVRFYLMSFYYRGYKSLITQMQKEIRLSPGTPRLDGKPFTFYIKKIKKALADLMIRLMQKRFDFMMMGRSIKNEEHKFIINKMTDFY